MHTKEKKNVCQIVLERLLEKYIYIAKREWTFFEIKLIFE